MASDGGSADYFRRREFAERGAAKRAASTSARRVHQELAQRYAQLALARPKKNLREVTPP